MESVIEHLGFAPVHFVDTIINDLNTQLYEHMSSFEQSLAGEQSPDETERVRRLTKGHGSHRNAV